VLVFVVCFVVVSDCGLIIVGDFLLLFVLLLALSLLTVVNTYYFFFCFDVDFDVDLELVGLTYLDFTAF